ncbi:MAG: bifunctional diaminohydroxyphosphoribosylaminopyrimidine deaminase/5-amino-6-(5-phosphoribosylamino)uracil reductase RibD [Planctomycetota bacterium]|nr:bifunctional diaminohydroxyphosphoribosylaminopyrimidine deaminase/5-amino-6-(5-phosphoribosylamino)uracil reductase RibD [Planctomycetota bacterium]
MPATPRDERDLLTLAARHALRALGRVEPNPMVGCVIARHEDGQWRVLGIGHHRVFGGAHAEREALASCRRQGFDTRGATMLVTLEPCSHHGKQPPCVPVVIESGVTRLVFAQHDPNPVASGGAKQVEAAGIRVEQCTASPIANWLSAPFRARLRGTPWVVAKWAQTIDGRIATRTGASQWISNEASRRRVHRLRGVVDAIVTGVSTVLADDPRLTARLREGALRGNSGSAGRQPRRVALRVVADSNLRVPLSSALIATARQTPTLIACLQATLDTREGDRRRAEIESLGVRVVGLPASSERNSLPAAQRALGVDARDGGTPRIDLGELFRLLARDCVASRVLVEAGGTLLGACLRADLVDEAHVFTGPLVLADEQATPAAMGHAAPALADARAFRLARVRALGDDAWSIYVRDRRL